MKCQKCGANILKSVKLNSGNSTYLVWKCDECGHEKMECVGVKD
jgi:ribosomal protein S27E